MLFDTHGMSLPTSHGVHAQNDTLLLLKGSGKCGELELFKRIWHFAFYLVLF